MERNWPFLTIWPVLDITFKVNCLSNVFSLLPVRLVQVRHDRLLSKAGQLKPSQVWGPWSDDAPAGATAPLSILTQPQSYSLRNSPGLLFSTALKHLGFCSISAKHMCHCLFPDLFWECCDVKGLICEGLRWGIVGRQIIQVGRATLGNQAYPSDNSFIPK